MVASGNSQLANVSTILDPSVFKRKAEADWLTCFGRVMLDEPDIPYYRTFRRQMNSEGLNCDQSRAAARSHVRNLIQRFETNHTTKKPNLEESWDFGSELNQWATGYSQDLRALDEKRMSALRHGGEHPGDRANMEAWLDGMKTEIFEDPERAQQLGA
jgi:hypothetical protein